MRSGDSNTPLSEFNTHGEWLWSDFRRHGYKLLSRNTATWRPVIGGRQHRNLAALPKTFSRNLVLCFFYVDKTSGDMFCMLTRFPKNCWRVKICSVALCPGRKPLWVLSSFGSIISRHIFLGHLIYTFPGRLRREMPRQVLHCFMSSFLCVSPSLPIFRCPSRREDPASKFRESNFSNIWQ